ncbi:MAG: hypothetical protein HY581_06770 [Nitrospirae bacterium]|nr:hypothetical protein [Nitrospirota bacterium]
MMHVRMTRLLISLVATLLLLAGTAWAQHKAEKVFTAIVTDAQGVETEVKNILFYWEEKVSETAFVPHELKQVPVKRGTATVNVRFDTIKQIDVKTGPDKTPPVFIITLTNGKTGEFALAIAGSFKGESDFGEVELPANGLKKIVFK